MGMSMFNAWAKDNKVPTFGYDANSDAVAAIAEGYGGTISQHADAVSYTHLDVYKRQSYIRADLRSCCGRWNLLFL